MLQQMIEIFNSQNMLAMWWENSPFPSNNTPRSFIAISPTILSIHYAQWRSYLQGKVYNILSTCDLAHRWGQREGSKETLPAGYPSSDSQIFTSHSPGLHLIELYNHFHSDCKIVSQKHLSEGNWEWAMPVLFSGKRSGQRWQCSEGFVQFGALLSKRQSDHGNQANHLPVRLAGNISLL